MKEKFYKDGRKRHACGCVSKGERWLNLCVACTKIVLEIHERAQRDSINPILANVTARLNSTTDRKELAKSYA